MAKVKMQGKFLSSRVQSGTSTKYGKPKEYSMNLVKVEVEGDQLELVSKMSQPIVAKPYDAVEIEVSIVQKGFNTYVNIENLTMVK